MKPIHPEPLLWDELIAKHKLTGKNGGILANTLDLPDDHDFGMFKDEYRNSYTYVFHYAGESTKCGDNGYVFFYIKNNTN